MRLLSILLFTFLIGTFFSGCRRAGVSEFGTWIPVGKEFDSLSNKLEIELYDYAPIDSIRESVEKLEKIAFAESESSLKKVMRERVLYWKARYFRRIEHHDSSLKLIKEALMLNDSSAYLYDRLQLLTMLYMYSYSIDGGTLYRHFDECIGYARKVGDKAFEASSAIGMGNLLGQIGEYDKALYYFRLADSINGRIGYKKFLIKNQINIARVITARGDKKIGDSILKSLVGHPCLEGDTFVNNLIARNIYGDEAQDSDVGYLYSAYNEIRDSKRFRYLRGLYNALLFNYSFRHGCYDSLYYYAERAKADLPYIREYEHRGIVWFNLSLYCSFKGDSDRALLCRIRYEACMDSARIKQKGSEVLRLSALHEMKAREAQYEASIFRRNVVTGFVIGALMLAGMMTAWMLNRRHLKQKVNAMENELELEKARKKMAATAISMEEKDKVLGVLKTGLSELREEGEVNEGNVRQMESAIKNHMLEHDTDESFQKMFDVVNPRFKQRLKERCPNLADSYVKLACYILMELDNKKIARLMMIKPESVHQARWRLRQRLGLKEGETLESALNALNEKR